MTRLLNRSISVSRLPVRARPAASSSVSLNPCFRRAVVSACQCRESMAVGATRHPVAPNNMRPRRGSIRPWFAPTGVGVGVDNRVPVPAIFSRALLVRGGSGCIRYPATSVIETCCWTTIIGSGEAPGMDEERTALGIRTCSRATGDRPGAGVWESQVHREVVRDTRAAGVDGVRRVGDGLPGR
jgi:hypothetical protein